ncbi:Gfo/Idh/MocA family protein [Atribacter laminatus]|uniref:1,5-anhydro-D-fructose reductase n=1 Tax=Atribacter laminatus TaxID=2847778 RepID=A0A7T1ALN4_ATRLM|nr:Gfo/Idh/MocA family oxidoreductase [Atribacter laminatus]QPM68159.1 1,5-anhydro-D-fructose reductase [Atribacter laminatus]
MIKCGIIGTGIMGDLHAIACKQYSKCELVSVCDIDEKRVLSFANKYNIPKTYLEFKEMIKNEDIDTVIIATPDYLHCDPVLAAIRAGKNVLVEKPMATTLNDAQLILKAAKDNKNLFMVNFSSRWIPTHQNTKKAILNGEVGDIRYGHIRLENTYYVPTKMLSWSEKSSPTEFLLPHSIDLIRWFLSSEVTEVYALKTDGVLRSLGINTHDSLQSLVTFSTGAVINFETSWILPETLPYMVENALRLVGSKGAIYTDLSKQCLQIYGSQTNSPGSFLMEYLNGKWSGFFFDSVCHFFDCILDNSQKPLTNVYDGYKNTEIIVAMIKSAMEKKSIQLPL